MSSESSNNNQTQQDTVMQEATAASSDPSTAAAAAASVVEQTLPNKSQKQEQLDISTLSPRDRDELASYRLRFSFQGVDFMEYYRDLCQVGWKFVGQLKYRPPDVRPEDIVDMNDEKLLTAMEIAEHLDYYSLANDLYSNLQHPTAASNKNNGSIPRLIAAGQEERWRKLRDEAIYHFFLRRYKKGTGADSDSDDESDDGSLGPAVAGGERRKRGKGKTKENEDENNSRPMRSRSNKNSSVTTADAGADLFFNKGTRKARQSRRAKQISANQKIAKKTVTTGTEEDNAIPFERLSLEECAAKVKEFDLDEVQEHEEAYREQFGEWRFVLSTNHSLMCYGFGSKFNLLNDFAQQELSKEGYTMILNGFDPDIKAEAILTLLVDLFLDGNEPPPHSNSIPGYEEEDVIKMDTVKKDKQSGKMKPITVKKARDPMERAKTIARAIAKTQAKELYPIFLVIHNLEGLGLRNRLAQETIASLVAHSKVKHCGVNAIRLVASVDHVDAPAMLWNASTMALYSWIWREVHTYRPYVQELVMLAKEEINTSSSKKRRSSGGAGKRQQAHLLIDGEGANKVTKVLQNLANRYTEVIQILATLQLEAQATAPKQQIHWVDEARLLQQCLNKCTVKSAPQLRTFLNELKDHELVVVQTQGSTSLMVRVPYTEEKLHEILAFRPDKNPGQ